MGAVHGIIGRDREVAMLEGFACEACAGHGSLLFVSGESGVGKTRLAREVLARHPLRVIAVTSLADVTPAYGPVLECLREWRRIAPSEFRKLGAFAEPVAGCLEGEPSGAFTEARFREALAGALLTMAKQKPTAWLLDDVHHADAATLDLLAGLAPRISGVALLTIGIYNAGEVGRDHVLRRLRTALRKTPHFAEITVRPLSAADSVRLVQACLGGEPSMALAQRLYDRAQGVPLYLEELCAALKADGRLQNGTKGLDLNAGEEVPVPERLQDAMTLRLHPLPPPARRFLEVAAVAGRAFDWFLVTRLAGDSSGGDAALDAGIVRMPEPGRGVFAHPLMREAVLAEIPWSRRRNWHAEIAAALAVAGAPPDRLVPHFTASGDVLRARAAWLEIARGACAMHAHEDAFHAFGCAMEGWTAGVDEPARVAALERYVECARASGHLSEASLGLQELIASPLSAQDRARRAERWRALAAVHVQEGAPLAAMAAHRAAADDWEAVGQVASAAADWYAISELGLLVVRLTEARAACERAIELSARANDHALRARALSQLALLCATLAEPDAARRFIEASLMLALEHDLPEEAAVAYRRLANTLEFASNYHAEVEAFGEALSYCHSRGLRAQQELCMGCLSYALFRSGEWSQCLRTARQVLRTRDANPGSRSGAQLALSLVAMHRGEIKTARRVLQEFDREVRAGGLVIYELFTIWELASLALLEGRPDEAGASFLRLLDTWERTEDRHEVLPGLRAAATYFERAGRLAEVNRCALAAGRIASVSANPEAAATLAFVLGESVLASGKEAEAAAHFRRASELFRRHELAVDGLAADARLGEVLCRTNERGEGERLLRDVLARARRLGARPLVIQVETALAEAPTSASSSEQAGSPWACLSTRQQEVARLLTEGLINKEIAARLRVSTRTVDMHVRHIFDRLACRTRAEAVRRLLRSETTR